MMARVHNHLYPFGPKIVHNLKNRPSGPKIDVIEIAEIPGKNGKFVKVIYSQILLF